MIGEHFVSNGSTCKEKLSGVIFNKLRSGESLFCLSLLDKKTCYFMIWKSSGYCHTSGSWGGMATHFQASGVYTKWIKTFLWTFPLVVGNPV